MSGDPKIVITVRPDGTVDARTDGILGAECLDYIAVLEDLLHAQTTTSEYTEDYTRTRQYTEEQHRNHDIERA